MWKLVTDTEYPYPGIKQEGYYSSFILARNTLEQALQKTLQWTCQGSYYWASDEWGVYNIYAVEVRA